LVSFIQWVSLLCSSSLLSASFFMTLVCYSPVTLNMCPGSPPLGKQWYRCTAKVLLALFFMSDLWLFILSLMERAVSPMYIFWQLLHVTAYMTLVEAQSKFWVRVLSWKWHVVSMLAQFLHLPCPHGLLMARFRVGMIDCSRSFLTCLSILFEYPLLVRALVSVEAA
jgi:hypothetical protein